MPFRWIEEGVEKTKMLLATFEPVKNGIDTTRKPLEEALSSIWTATAERLHIHSDRRASGERAGKEPMEDGNNKPERIKNSKLSN